MGNKHFPQMLPALRPNGTGAQFVFYGDSCSGVPGAPHEATHARVNRVVQRFDPAPEFIVYPGDEIIGLVADENALRAQWRHWFDVEMAWLDRTRTPIFNATGNHTVYDAMSARVFADVMAHAPRNGPPGQDGLAYAVRRDDLLIVVVNTLDQTRGGEGHIETDWLATTLRSHADARWKFVVGHHPAYPVNGYVGPYQRTIGDEYVGTFWRILVENRVVAYLCSHILAFDVQCRAGVLQICSAGAGTAHRMPEGEEYLHAVQMAVDGEGLRYQVVDDAGRVRESLTWPPALSAAMTPAARFAPPTDAAPIQIALDATVGPSGTGARQTLYCAFDGQSGAMPFWLGLVGVEQRLTAVLQPTPGRSPHQWLGPGFDDGERIAVDLLLHPKMGPGGLLWRLRGADAWNSLDGASAWGMERLIWPDRHRTGDDPAGASPFAGVDLRIRLGVASQSSTTSPS